MVNDRIVIIGSIEEESGGHPAIWWEGQDLVWQQATIPTTGGNAWLSDVTAGGPGLVAVGWDWVTPERPRPLVWLSSDGRSWDAVDTADLGQGQIGRVGVTEAGLVAFATEAWDDVSPVAWTSSDGRDWQPSYSESVIEVASSRALVGSGATLTAFLQPRPAAGDETESVSVSVWRASSPDVWTKLAELPSSNGARVDVAAAGPLGWVAAGGTEERWLAWTSSDGVTWQLAASAPAHVQAIFGDGAGFIGVGFYDPVGGCVISESNFIGQTWTSNDGRVWRLVDEFAPGHWIETLRKRGRTLIGIGLSFTEGLGKGTVWTARLPDTVSQPIAPPAVSPSPIPTSNGCGP